MTFTLGGVAAFEEIVSAIDSHVKVGSREKDDFLYAGVHVKKTMYTPVAHPSACLLYTSPSPRD